MNANVCDCHLTFRVNCILQGFTGTTSPFSSRGFFISRDTAAQGSLTFEKAELNAASHALSDKSRHVVILINDAHFHGEALPAHWRPVRHLHNMRNHTFLVLLS